ncbi:MAG: hypothetical protein U0R52_09975 [Solirubrobacterales bacterium]
MLSSRFSRSIAQCLSLGAIVGLGTISVLGPQPVLAANTFPGTNGRLALLDTTGFNEKLRVVAKRGGLTTILRTGDYFDSLSFSPSGTRIVYTYNFGAPWRNLAIANVVTGNSRTLEMGKLSAGSAAFLDDGRIVFSGYYPNNERPGTYVIRRNGTLLHRLFKRTQLAATPDGRWFLATQEGPASQGRWLDLLNSRGRVVRRLVSDPTHRHSFYNVAFSPNGRWIVYEKLLDTYSKRIADLYLVRRDGTHRRRLTFSGRAEDPIFSPDGRWIAFRRSRGWNNYYSNIQALLVSDPTVKRWITHGQRRALSGPIWARSGPPRPPRGSCRSAAASRRCRQM